MALLIGAPWLQSGYLFGTDWPGPRHFSFPSTVSSFDGLQAALALAGDVLSAEIVAKILVLGILFTASVTAYRALPFQGFPQRSIASLLYVVNPFVYGRLQYGQLFLLAGYSILPWAASRMRDLLLEPRLATALTAAASFALLGILDLHLLLVAAVLAVAVLVTHAAPRWQDRDYLARLGRSILITSVVTLTASIYWLLPLLTAGSAEGRILGRVGNVDLRGFQTVADPQFGLLPNVLGLYGFWAEATHRFSSMKDFVPFWPVALAALLLLAIVGASATMASSRGTAFAGARPWVLGLVLMAVMATILDVGVADPHVAPIIRWLDAIFPPYRGMRDAGKWAALLAFAYSQLVPLGVAALMAWIRRFLAGRIQTLAEGAIVAVGLALSLYYGNGLLFGMHGQIRPSAYPPGWYAADRALAAEPAGGKAVFLPWHLYLSLSFVRNANRIVASPAPSFFSVPVVISSDPESPPVEYVENPDQRAVSALVASGAQSEWASHLADQDIKYVLLAREVDWRRYAYLNHQAGLLLIGDFGSILLYRNTLWHPISAAGGRPRSIGTSDRAVGDSIRGLVIRTTRPRQ